MTGPGCLQAAGSLVRHLSDVANKAAEAVVGLFIHRQLNVRDLPGIVLRSMLMSSVVLFIIATASVFSWPMTVEEIPSIIASRLLAILLVDLIFITFWPPLTLFIPRLLQ